MASEQFLDEVPGEQGEGAQESGAPGQVEDPLGEEGNDSRLLLLWESLRRAGLGDKVLRLGTHILSIAMVLLVIWTMRIFYRHAQVNTVSEAANLGALAAALPTLTPTSELLAPPPFVEVSYRFEHGIPRLALLHTDIPSRPRTEVITYTVQTGDTIFGIAEKFGLSPETILWGNTYILGDNPHLLSPGQALNILPLNGTYHKWSRGEGLNGVSSYYGVDPEDIINWPGNHLDPEAIGDWSNPNIEPGKMLVVPGGERDFVTWSAPRISRSNPGVAKILGPGSCGIVVDGAVGIGAFIWPANAHSLSGYDFSPGTNHFGIDIAGRLGDPIYASDNGVIVYAGWNNWGYGNVVVIDHGGGWQTLYAHLSSIGVGCGQSVFQGNVIGSFGSTGNSSGPHLHFEMLNESFGKVNPWNFLP